MCSQSKGHGSYGNTFESVYQIMMSNEKVSDPYGYSPMSVHVCLQDSTAMEKTMDRH